MNKRRLNLVCFLLMATVGSMFACKGEGSGALPGGSGGSNGGTMAGGGATSMGGAATGGASGTGGVPGSGGSLIGSGGAVLTGGSVGGMGGKSSSLISGTGGLAGNKGTGGVSAMGGVSDGGTAKGGATGVDGGSVAGGLTLYYIRHAQVVANTLDPSQITTENMDALTDLGIRQVEVLTTYLDGLGITPDAILVSPHVRAQRTIGPYLLAKKLTGEVWMELAETSDKASTSAPIPADPKYIKYYKATLEVPNLAFRDPTKTEFWQNDNYESGLLMVMTAKDGILERYGRSGKTIFVVGHAIAGQLLIGLLRGDNLIAGPPTTGSSAVYILNTGVMRLVQDPSTGLFKLDGRNINNPTTQ